MSTKRAIATLAHPLAVLSLAILATLTNSAAAVIIHPGDGSGNTTAPANDPGWDYVGEFKGGSAIYLGNRWVITANHLGSGSTMTLLGESFDVVAGSEKQLMNPYASGLTTVTDLKLFQIDRDPGLPLLAISQVPPGVGAEVVMIGRGRNRETDLTFFDIDTSAPSPIWTETSDLAQSDASGYRYAVGQTMRWGTNRIADDTVYNAWKVDRQHNLSVSIRFAEKSVDVVALVTKFDDTGETAFEAQVATGDSGGAVFYNNFPDEAGAWELAGVIHAMDISRGQPSATAILGNLTFLSDLSVYRDQIKAITSAVAPILISMDSSTGQTYFQDFDDLGSVGSVLPDGWVARTGLTTNLTITRPFPSTTVANGTYNGGSGGDRTLATGNRDRDAPNAIELWGQFTGEAEVRAVVVESRVEAWAGDRIGDENPGEAAFLISLEYDSENDGTFDTAHAFNAGRPVTTGLALTSSGTSGTLFNGNGPEGVSFSSGVIELDTPIPADSLFRLKFDARSVGQTGHIIFGVDDVLFRVVSPGDADGDGVRDSKDLLAILMANKFNNPAAGPASWSEGDFNGDGQVTSVDLFLILESNSFNSRDLILAPGDTDGDGNVDISDLMSIQTANKFNNPAAGPADWSEGDFNGDGQVTSVDLFLILESGTNLWAAETTNSPTALATVPEPATFILAAFGLAGLVPFIWRTRRQSAWHGGNV